MMMTVTLRRRTMMMMMRMKMIMVVIMALFMTMTVIVQIRGWWCWWCGEWWRLNGMVLKKSYTYLSYLYLFCLFLVIIHHNLKKKMSWMYCSFLISSSEIVHPPLSGYNLLLWFFSVRLLVSTNTDLISRKFRRSGSGSCNSSTVLSVSGWNLE